MPAVASLNESDLTNVLPDKWEKSEKAFSSNEVIDAFFYGKKIGKQEMDAIYKRQFKENLKTAIEASETLSSFIEGKLKIKIKSIHIKPEDVSNFCTLFVLSNQNEFVSDKFKKTYHEARTIKNGIASDAFDIEFIFSPFTEYFNEKCLNSDGFILKNDKERTSRTRKTQHRSM